MKIKLMIISIILLFFILFTFISISDTDKYSQDRKTNLAVIAQKAEKNINYKLLFDLAEDYELVIGIRKFDMGNDAKKNETIQQGYTWKFLTDRDDNILDKHVTGLFKTGEFFRLSL